MLDLINTAISLVTLTVLEIVLGIDNLVFIIVSSNRLPVEQQQKARRFGLALAWISRLLLLASAVYLSRLTTPIFTVYQFSASIRDLFLIFGGFFLLFKSVQEIHYDIEEKQSLEKALPTYPALSWVVIQIATLDIIFSLDSVLTAIGLTDHFWVMAMAITIAIFVMILSSEWITTFIEKHPTFKMLALSFLTLIGVVLIADGFHHHIPREYIYCTIAFSLGVECLNLLKRKNSS